MSSTPTAKRSKGATAKKPEFRPTRIASPVSAETDRELIAIPLEKLHRHPDNREIDPASVAELVASLSDHGQREPIRVRPLSDPIGHYEILSGERRFVAAQQVQPRMDTLLAIVERHGDSQSLIELAVANAARQDLNPIERGELLAKLIAPLADGGAGLERAAAGRVFGLNSESGIKNALRLLKLPKYFRDLLISGQASITVVRPLCAYPNEVLELFASHLQVDKWSNKYFLNPEDPEHPEDEFVGFLDQKLRPCDSHKHNMGWQLGGDWPCLFKVDELDAKQRKELQLVEIPDEKNKGKTRLVALNEKAWHKLQDPLVKVAHAKKQSGGKSKSKSVAEATGEKATPPTAAELKAKRKKADEQLAVYTRDWVTRSLRCQLSQHKSWTADPAIVTELIPWLIANCYESSQQKFNEWAIADASTYDKKLRGDAATFHGKIAEIGSTEFYCALWRVILWPAASHNASHPDLVLGSIPERLPAFKYKSIEDLALGVGVSIETVWEAARSSSIQQALVGQWMARHTKEQLVDLSKSLGHSLDDKDQRAVMVDKLLDWHKLEGLKLPAMIKKAGAK